MMEGKKLLTARDVLYIFFKNRLIITTVFFTSIVISVIYCLLTPPVYRAETKILIRMGRAQGSAIEQYRPETYNVVFSERTQNIRNEMELLKGQYLTEKVIARLKDRIEPLKTDESIIGTIAEGVKTAVGTIPSWLGLSSKPLGQEKGMVLTFLSALHLTYLEDTDMISVAFDWTDPKFAALVANVYADEFVTQHMVVYESQQSYRFYSDQIALFEKKLKDVEDRLQTFTSSSNIANIALQKELLLRSIADLQNQYNQAVVDTSQSQIKVSKIREMARNVGWVETPETASHVNIADKQAYLRTLDESYFKLQTERERLLKFYTTKSDEVRSIDNELAGLRRQKIASLLNVASLELSLVQNKKASLADEIAGEMKKLVNINEKTATLKQLERERDITEQNYQIYKKKAEDLRISDDLDSRRISDAKVATPAIPPLTPAYPKKRLIVIISALVGLVLGFGFSAFSEFFNHTFRGNEDIVDVLGVPLLLSVPLVMGADPRMAPNGMLRRGTDALRRMFGGDYRRPVAYPSSYMAGGTHTLTFLMILVIGMGGYILYLHKTTIIMMSEALHATRTVSERPAGEQQVSLASVYPVQILKETQAAPAVPPLPDTGRKTGGDAALLSDDLEKRRLELEKRRSEIESELEKVKTEIETHAKKSEIQKSNLLNGEIAHTRSSGAPEKDADTTGRYHGNHM
jgi:uncharacterized protein involved in exopolysaccharide biosynthesis